MAWASALEGQAQAKAEAERLHMLRAKLGRPVDEDESLRERHALRTGKQAEPPIP